MDQGLTLSQEWLLTNGLGGYAAGTVTGAITRRFHGLLVAALPAPLGRVVMLSQLSEEVLLPDGGRAQLGDELLGGGGPPALAPVDFHLEVGLPVWRYQIQQAVLERRVVLSHRQNTVYVLYRLLGGGPIELSLRPLLNPRRHDGPVALPVHEVLGLSVVGARYELFPTVQKLPPLRLRVDGPGEVPVAFTMDGKTTRPIQYEVERARGYDYLGELLSPGYFRLQLSSGQGAALVASSEPWEVADAMRPDEALRRESERRHRLLQRAQKAADPFAQELVLAADQFLIAPIGRVEDTARAHASGEEVRTVIAGYPWFTDWGRDTMISLEGLTLRTGRADEAAYILHTFGQYVRDGLIPNLFPEGGTAGLYHTADATLWYFHAVDRYLQATSDRRTLQRLLPTLLSIIEQHQRGTRFGIHVDPADGLLHQGQAGLQLTWMDAKVGDWVVTPRRGKAVEVNALYYNALRLVEGWVRDEQGDAAARPYGDQAERTYASFNRRFRYRDGGYLYDVVDAEGGGDDPACRPNQVFALSLRHPVLAPEDGWWGRVLDVVRGRLLTPVGLRSLSPGSPDYKACYDGDLRSRDAAYHQGTVWAWLIGHFIDAWLRVYPGPAGRAQAREALLGFVPHLRRQACLGSISEIFDAEAPYTPRGCVAQAWSVAEVLRAWLLTEDERPAAG